MKKLIIMALILSAGWAVHKPTFTEFDLNNDGQVTKSEFDEVRTKRMQQRTDEGKMFKNAGEGHSFEQIDINKDGWLSNDEFILHEKMHHGQSCITFG